jgi:hypothetical protein
MEQEVGSEIIVIETDSICGKHGAQRMDHAATELSLLRFTAVTPVHGSNGNDGAKLDSRSQRTAWPGTLNAEALRPWQLCRIAMRGASRRCIRRDILGSRDARA